MLGFRLPFARRKGYGMGAAGGGKEGAVVDPTLVFDQFTDTNGTDLNVHTIAPTNTPATGWTALSGTVTVQSNRAQGAGNYVCNPGIADGVIDATVSADTGQGTSIIARSTGATNQNQWRCQLLGGTTPTLRIQEINAGSTLNRATSNLSAPTAGTQYPMKVTLSGSTITMLWDSVNSLSYASATFQQTATQHGLMMYNNSANATVDDWKITA